jgi:hypothetical protein
MKAKNGTMNNERKSISIKDLIKESLQQGKETDKFVHEALARGGRSLLLDENVKGLRSFLQKKNYTASVAIGTDDQIKENLIRNHVFISDDDRGFLDFQTRQLYYYGLILVPNEMDSKNLANLVEKVLMAAGFGNNLLQVWQIYSDGTFDKTD